MNFFTVIAAVTVLSLTAATVEAAGCSNTSSGFDQFKRDFAKEARAAGVGEKGLHALATARYSKSVIRKDRSQKSFNKDFNTFYKLHTASLQGLAKRNMKRFSRTLNAIEKQFGVQGEVLIAIWGMESGFGNSLGNDDIVDALASLTHDCRRSEFFRPNLIAALKILDRGHLSRANMRGTHGEIGQTRFMAKDYLNYGFDWDRNGRVDLIGSRADVLASIANYLKGHGWKRGGSYQPGSHNYRVLKEWDAAQFYQKAIAKFALAIAP